MRSLPYNFARHKNLQNNSIIDLVIVESHTVYVSDITGGSIDRKKVRLTEELSVLFTTAGIQPYGSGDGWGWVVTFESGINVGTSRLVTGIEIIGSFIWLVFDVALPYSTVTTGRDKDFIRISKNLFLTNRQSKIDFFLPDNSSTATDQTITFVPFPFSVEPVGTNITGEVLNMSADISNVNRYLGNLVQQADGLRGNRVIFLRTFEGVYDQGRHFCMRDVMYIDSVSIDAQTVHFTLEGRFNIVGLTLPNGRYMRNYCRHTFRDVRCGWTERLDPEYVYANKTSPVNPLKKIGEVSCDHSLMGPNGCVAHQNARRFGGFPSIPSK